MADIVQLKEDGVAKYLKTHAKAIDGVEGVLVKATGNETILGTKNFQDGLQVKGTAIDSIIKNVVYNPTNEPGGFFNDSDSFVLGKIGSVEKVVLIWSQVDDSGVLVSYGWGQSVFYPDDLEVGKSYWCQLKSNYGKFVRFSNSGGNLVISGANENTAVKIFRIKKITSYVKK